MKRPITYRQWAKQAGKSEELGAKALIADRLYKELGKAKIPSIIAPQLADTIAKGFLNYGVEPFFPQTNIELWIEDDRSYRAKEFGVVIDGIQGKRPIQYLAVAYYAWQQAQGKVNEWENKDLAEYLQHWLFKKKRGKKQTRLVRELLDKINPEWND
jgi:hypothetical protein